MRIDSNEAKSIFRLAGPVLLARLGSSLIITADTVMCGYAGSRELAIYGIGNALHLLPLFLGVGLIIGVVVLTATHEGAGNQKLCGQVLKVGLIHAVSVGLLIVLLLQFGEPFLLLTGQSDDLAHGSGRVLIMHSIGIVPGLAMITISLFLEGLQRPIPGMITMLFANIINVALNWILIFGHLGAPPMGAEGAALATSIVRWLTFIGLACYVFKFVDNQKFSIRTRLVNGMALSKVLRRLGYPVGVAHGIEAIAFAALTVFAGLMGVIPAAVWAVCTNLITFTFMFSLGFATAGSVRVAYNLGQGSHHKATQAGYTATVMVLLVLAMQSIAMVAAPEFIARIYNQEPAVLLLATPLVALTALAVIPYGLQVVLIGILRGLQDMWMISLALFIAFIVITVPFGYIAGIVNDGAPTDLMTALALGSAVATVLLMLRFWKLTQTRAYAT